MRFLLASTEASTAGFRDEAQLFVEGKKRSDATRAATVAEEEGGLSAARTRRLAWRGWLW